MDLLAAPRDPHKHQPPLLLEVLRTVEAPLVRKDAVLHGDDVNNRKLQALGGMERHQRHPVGRGVPGIGIGDECCRLKKSAERIDGRRVVCGSRETIVELPGRSHEFFDVGESVLSLFVLVLFLCEHRAVARPLEHRLKDRGNRRFLPGHGRQFGHEPRKPGTCDRRPLGHAGNRGGVRHRVEPRSPVILGPGCEPVE